MSTLNPEKLYVSWNGLESGSAEITPRRYTLTHSDRTGDLYLTIGQDYDQEQISGLYTRIMRDEVLAEWIARDDGPEFHVHCHVSGGIVLGSEAWRASIFEYHLPQVLQAFRYGDQGHFTIHPHLDRSTIMVHFHARQPKHQRVLNLGIFADYTLEPS